MPRKTIRESLIHHKMLPASRTMAMKQTSKMMRTAVKRQMQLCRRGEEFSSQTAEGLWTS
jgi:hypothetical protein